MTASFDARNFRNALGHFATGVAIVTAAAEGRRLGMTVNSFNAVSLSPPLVLFSIARSAVGLAQWQSARHYGVTLLADSQNEISNRFARAGADKWQGIDDLRMQNGAPLLPDWLAYFECERYAVHEGGDHEILVSRVLRFAHRGPAADPLLFYRGKYRSLRSENAFAAHPDAEAWAHGW